ncbi:hypothetical protein L2E82_08987 [Cichorium intybus]|uniref:Uncharacterized protein n=1 Tax=Cichorium intybus TaxID=13427 RepID=A0ACB9G8D6_CICIN|nr:hypothetical protein L2E82_08987 [Cichorium intybus]
MFWMIKGLLSADLTGSFPAPICFVNLPLFTSTLLVLCYDIILSRPYYISPRVHPTNYEHARSIYTHNLERIQHTPKENKRSNPFSF